MCRSISQQAHKFCNWCSVELLTSFYCNNNNNNIIVLLKKVIIIIIIVNDTISNAGTVLKKIYIHFTSYTICIVIGYICKKTWDEMENITEEEVYVYTISYIIYTYKYS